MAEKPADMKLSDDEKLWGALAYFLGFVISIFGPIVAYFIKKDSKFVKFHAIQSIIFAVAAGIVFGGLWFVTFILAVITGGLGALLGILLLPLGLVFLAVYVYAGYKAYTGEMYKIPVVGGFAMKYAG
jgi:uncharacterized membrane protein